MVECDSLEEALANSEEVSVTFESFQSVAYHNSAFYQFCLSVIFL